MHIRRTSLLLSLLIACISGWASPPDSLLRENYVFLNTEANTVQNQNALLPFYKKLQELEQGDRKQVRVLHIGDSHLQADYFSGEVRRLMQNRFGNAGRGFVFPYRAAKTNGPPDYRSGYLGRWESKRLVFPHKQLPIGLSGITLSTDDTNALVYVRLKDDDLYQTFNQVTVFRQPGNEYFDLALGVKIPEGAKSHNAVDGYKYHRVRSGESLGVIARRYGTSVYRLKQLNNLRSDLIRVGQNLVVGVEYRRVVEEEVQWEDLYCIGAKDGPVAVTCRLPDTSSTVYVRHLTHGENQKNGIIYGLSLEDTKSSGVLYHTIGVNGAQYSHYNEAAHFVEQAKELNPDLIIISMGTNESFNTRLEEEEFYAEIDTLISRLSRANPEAVFLITSQPDTYKRRRYRNQRNLMIRSTLESYANNRFTGFWDLNQVMGGYGSMYQWYRKGLTARDKVHFSGTGYRLQGSLLFNALMEGYDGLEP